MKVSWEKPEGDVTCFKVKIHPSDAKKPTVKTKDGETTKVQFTGLTPGKEYKIEVTSISGKKESEKVTVSETTGEIKVWFRGCCWILRLSHTVPSESKLIID